jgi:hypothetical protein
VKQPQCIFGDVNEATPDSAHSPARLNGHPSSRTDVSSIPATSEPLNLTPPPIVTESKGAEPLTGEEEEEEAMAAMGKRNNTADSWMSVRPGPETHPFPV